MSTSPFRADTPVLLATSIGVHTAVAIDTPGGLVDLDVQTASLSYDEARAPRVQADITARVPPEQATLDALDPRRSTRLVVTTGYLRPDGVTDVHELADLGLRIRSVNRPANTVTLQGASDEAVVLDAAAAPEAVTPSQTSVSTAVRQLVNYGLGAPAAFTVTQPDSVPADPIVVEYGTGDLWATIDDQCDKVGADVYADGLRRWWLTPRPRLAAPAARLVVGAGGTVLDARTDLTREDWHNAVQLVYRWAEEKNAGGTVVQVPRLLAGRAAATTGPYAAGPGNRRVYSETRQLPLQQLSDPPPITQPAADTAARSILARRLAHGRSLTLSAISHLWLRPGHTVEVLLPTGPEESYLLSAVTFDLLAGRMSLRLRRPDTATTITTGA